MNIYQQEISRIKAICFPNDQHLEMVIAIRNYIDNNSDLDVNLDLLSEIRFTSKFHLLRLFKRYYGLTPKHYLTIRRMEESKKCLKQGMSVSQTCYAVGYSTPSSFSTIFKQKVGICPILFQKEQLSQSELKPDRRT